MELTRLSCSFVIAMFACLLIMAPAFGGDDDKASAYKIYIDPETGKYTTQDPHAATVPVPAAVSPVTRDQDDSLWRLVMAAASILVISFAVISITKRRQTTSRLR